MEGLEHISPCCSQLLLDPIQHSLGLHLELPGRNHRVCKEPRANDSRTQTAGQNSTEGRQQTGMKMGLREKSGLTGKVHKLTKDLLLWGTEGFLKLCYDMFACSFPFLPKHELAESRK